MAKDRERKEALRLLGKGISVSEVARRLQVSRRSIYSWRKAAQGDEEEPQEGQRPRSPRNITEEQADELKELAAGGTIPARVYVKDEADRKQYLGASGLQTSITIAS